MDSIFIVGYIIVFIIGIVMINKHYKQGWTPPVLSGIAFVLLTLPVLVPLFF